VVGLGPKLFASHDREYALDAEPFIRLAVGESFQVNAAQFLSRI
jgi:hypothetical protein